MKKIKGNSKYFQSKYGTSNPEIESTEKLDFHKSHTSASFLFIGRALAEGIPTDSKTLYIKIKGRGEFVHESEVDFGLDNLQEKLDTLKARYTEKSRDA